MPLTFLGKLSIVFHFLYENSKISSQVVNDICPIFRARNLPLFPVVLKINFCKKSKLKYSYKTLYARLFFMGIPPATFLLYVLLRQINKKKEPENKQSYKNLFQKLVPLKYFFYRKGNLFQSYRPKHIGKYFVQGSVSSIIMWSSNKLDACEKFRVGTGQVMLSKSLQSVRMTQ